MSYIINGGNSLSGEIKLQGCKNAVLPILIGSILNRGENIIHNVPLIEDVFTMREILISLGCEVKIEGNTFYINSKNLNNANISEKLIRKMRSSIVLMGALIALEKECTFTLPGGCDIGLRPIDMHLKALKQLGGVIEEENGVIKCYGNNLKGTNIQLDFPSVGATENLMFAAIFADGVTSIGNAAKEPEIIDLQNFLNSMGARVYGAGGNTVYIEGMSELKKFNEYTVMEDRIVAGTFMSLVHMTGGEVFIKGCKLEHMKAIYYKLLESNLNIKKYCDGVLVKSDGKIHSVDSIITLPYPGFPTDMQSQMSAMLTLSDGVSIINETIFENRFKYTSFLQRMGADITVTKQIAIIKGVKELHPAKMYATDLRGGACLVNAALAARGESVIENVEYIKRGYENYDEVLRGVGADIREV